MTNNTRKWYISTCQSPLGDMFERFGRLAQLVRALALQARGHRFESYIAHHYFFAEIAQLVEQLTCGIDDINILNYLAPLIGNY